MRHWHVYIIRCADNSLYTGVSTDPARRLRQHAAGAAKGAKYAKGRTPLKLVWQAECPDRGRAQKLEYAIKRLDKSAKERLARGESAAPRIGD